MKLLIPYTFPLWMDVSNVPINSLHQLGVQAVEVEGGGVWGEIGTITITDTEAINDEA